MSQGRQIHFAILFALLALFAMSATAVALADDQPRAGLDGGDGGEWRRWGWR